MKSSVTVVILVVVCLSLNAPPAGAWGDEGHRWINLIAAQKLPQDMPAFFRDASARLSFLGPEPDLDPANANHQVTLHHNYYFNMQDRLPRLRAGNAHAYDIYVNNAEAFAAKTLRDARVAAMTPSEAAKLNGSSATYSFDVVLNGSISMEGGAVLLEKSQLIGVIYPLRNNQKDATLAQYTGKILALDVLYQLDTLVFRGDSNTPGSPLAPVPAPELPFSWNGLATLPYSYTTHDPTQLPSLLTGTDGAGAGKLVWAKDNWLKTSY